MVIEQKCKRVGRHKYKWELCDQCLVEFYRVYVKKTLLCFTWWERINEDEITTIDEVHKCIEDYEKGLC